MKDLLLEKRISNHLATLQKQSRNLSRLFSTNPPLRSMLAHILKLRKSLNRLDHLLIEHFIKEGVPRYKYPGDREKFIQDIVRLHRYCG